MEINYPTKGKNKFYVIITLLKSLQVKPFQELTDKEIKVYAELLTYYLKYKDLSEKEINRLIFNYDTRQEIAETLDIVSIDAIYNIICRLKKKGLIESNSLNKAFTDKLMKFNTDNFKIKFV